MTLVVPNNIEAEILTAQLNQALTLRLYSNNRVPAGTDLVAQYTEVAGGGYAAVALTFANWVITEGAPTIALYNTFGEFSFTGTTNAPGTIFGYYVTRDSDGKLMWAERFPSGSVPFTPVNGSLIRVTPRITADS